MYIFSKYIYFINLVSYRNCGTAGYVFVRYFRSENLNILCIFFKEKFQSSQLQRVYLERNDYDLFFSY